MGEREREGVAPAHWRSAASCSQQSHCVLRRSSACNPVQTVPPCHRKRLRSVERVVSLARNAHRIYAHKQRVQDERVWCVRVCVEGFGVPIPGVIWAQCVPAETNKASYTKNTSRRSRLHHDAVVSEHAAFEKHRHAIPQMRAVISAPSRARAQT